VKSMLFGGDESQSDTESSAVSEMDIIDGGGGPESVSDSQSEKSSVPLSDTSTRDQVSIVSSILDEVKSNQSDDPLFIDNDDSPRNEEMSDTDDKFQFDSEESNLQNSFGRKEDVVEAPKEAIVRYQEVTEKETPKPENKINVLPSPRKKSDKLDSSRDGSQKSANSNQYQEIPAIRLLRQKELEELSTPSTHHSKDTNNTSRDKDSSAIIATAATAATATTVTAATTTTPARQALEKKPLLFDKLRQAFASNSGGKARVSVDPHLLVVDLTSIGAIKQELHLWKSQAAGGGRNYSSTPNLTGTIQNLENKQFITKSNNAASVDAAVLDPVMIVSSKDTAAGAGFDPIADDRPKESASVSTETSLKKYRIPLTKKTSLRSINSSSSDLVQGSQELVEQDESISNIDEPVPIKEEPQMAFITSDDDSEDGRDIETSIPNIEERATNLSSGKKEKENENCLAIIWKVFLLLIIVGSSFLPFLILLYYED